MGWSLTKGTALNVLGQDTLSSMLIVLAHTG